MKMREVCKRTLSYSGYELPESLDEMAVEIAGLKHVIKQAETEIAKLEQSYQLYSAAIRQKLAQEKATKDESAGQD